MQIQLSEDRKEALIRSLSRFYSTEFDEDLSQYRAQQLLDLFIKELGPSVYNQAIQDARGFMQEKLDDLEGDVYIPEAPRS